jgi:hypothetical protein
MMRVIIQLFIPCFLLTVGGVVFAVNNKAPVPERENAKNFCTACHAGDKSVAQAASAKGKEDLVPFVMGVNHKIEDIGRQIEYLSNKHADVDHIKIRLEAGKLLFRRFVHEFSKENMESTKNILETEISSLDKEAKSKISLVRYLDILYIAALGFNLLIIMGILIYALVAYAKRKDSAI